MGFVSEGDSQNLQDFIGASFELHVLLHYGDKTIGNDGAVDLDSDSVLGSTPKFLDFEMLLEPLEKQFYLPSVLVQIGYLKCGDVGCVC